MIAPLRSTLASAAVLALVGACSGACSGKDPFNPGTKVGTFRVSANLKQTTCGATPNPWEFEVRINHDGTTLYWIQGGLPIEGKVDATARTELKAEIVQDLRAADSRTKRAACAVARTDLMTVTLRGADAQPTADPALATGFAGALGYVFSPTAGSDCEDQLSTAGGDFEALPCEVHYDLVGTLARTP